jgi:hypothetical protein
MHRRDCARRRVRPALGELRDYAGACFGDHPLAGIVRGGPRRRTPPSRDSPPSPSSPATRRRSQGQRRPPSNSVASTSSSASEIRARAKRSPTRAPDHGPFPPYPSLPPLTCHQPQALHHAAAHAPHVAHERASDCVRQHRSPAAAPADPATPGQRPRPAVRDRRRRVPNRVPK